MLICCGFNLRAADIFTAPYDNVFLAVDDKQVAVLVEITNVARFEKAIGGKRISRGVVIIPITVEVGDCADANLTAFALLQYIPVIVEHLNVDQWFGCRARAGWLFQIIVGEIAATDAIGFSEAITQ